MKDEMNYCERKKKKKTILFCVRSFICLFYARLKVFDGEHRTQPNIFMQMFGHDFWVFDLPLTLSLRVTAFSSSMCVFFLCLFGITTTRPNKC